MQKHAGIETDSLMQMQGRVTDGHYINAPFIAGMNAPILDFLRNYGEENLLDISDVSNEYWWPVQWDPGHWLDKVFNAFKETPFVNRLLKRTALYHKLFGHGKMHGISDGLGISIVWSRFRC